MTGIIQRDRSIIPACDVPLEIFHKILLGTADIDAVGGYKIGPALTGRPGYDAVVSMARQITDKPLIFDAQKWGTDIPDTAESLLGPVRDSGIETIILFPQSGPITEFEWILTAQRLGLNVIVGGEMTHPGYREGDEIKTKRDYSQIFANLGMDLPTGFIRRNAPNQMYEIATRMGVMDFVVPGNKPDSISRIRRVIEENVLAKEKISVSYFAPGFVEQGGEISKGGDAAGKRFHGIVGRGVYWDNGKSTYNDIVQIRNATGQLVKNL
ncbi:hypothetical protein COU60_03875 [Candidatus Pacearchaeota archaeon CG10_big_fil_rev_8_21_14_0_10_34_76]|nr:MAG: hypothetical protein COU60_03875 [Candidatus Pacearchaeota archaeon CG10_big_fil_rev_8_21_14_0_10_34_76]